MSKPLLKESAIMTVPMEAVDAEVAHDRWVLVTMPRGILVMDIERLKVAERPDKPQWVRKATTILSPNRQNVAVDSVRRNSALQETGTATN